MYEEKRFPEGFHWGAATASYQVEGGIDNNDWAEAARGGRVPESGRLADHYHRFKEDFDIAKSLGQNAHRFSVEWSRIEPTEGQFDQGAIDHYRAVLKALKDRGIEPYITLWHFTIPTWFAESGGFERADGPEVFAKYCQFVVSELKDLCQHFSTMNEPNVYATHGFLYGAWPPFKRLRIFWKKIGKEDGTSERTKASSKFLHLFAYFKVERNLVLAHKLAYKKIKSAVPGAKVSIVKHVHVFTADENWFNGRVAYVMRYFQTHRFMKRLENAYDEIGLNYYRTTNFGDNKNYLMTDMLWKAYPSGVYHALMALNRYDVPIFVAEAGIADEDDDLRGQYIDLQIKAIHKAIERGVKVTGHMYWSLMDNYEWALGTTKRFGLVEIDYRTLERTIRPSAQVYKKICEDNGIL